MEEATEAVREPRYWKITVNPGECPKGAWEVCRSTGLAMLGLPGEQGEAGYAVRNMKRVCEGDWLVAYTPQAGAYTVGGVGRVIRSYRCEDGPFDHLWNGTVRRSLGVDWHAGACSIADLVKDADRLSTLRLLKSALGYAQIERKTESLSDADVVALVQKEVKKRRDSAEQFEKGGRAELAAKELAVVVVRQGVAHLDPRRRL